MAWDSRPEVIEQVEAVLNDTGRPPRAINAALPDLTRSAVCASLLWLVRHGRAARDGETGSFLYRRTTEAT